MLAADSTLTGCDGCATMTTLDNSIAYSCQALEGFTTRRYAATMMSFETPEWVRDAVFYQIFPDRFAYSQRMRKPSNLEPWDSPPTTYGFKGGDLFGVAEHLDYLAGPGDHCDLFHPCVPVCG